MTKTKDMIIDLRRTASSLKLTAMEGGEMDFVNHKDLGTDNILCFQANSDAISNKVQRSRYFLRKINSFNVCTKMMTFYFMQCFIEWCCPTALWLRFGNLDLAIKIGLVGLSVRLVKSSTDCAL